MRTLGLDASTQSLSGLIIDLDTGKVVHQHSISFGARLPSYGCPNGFLPNDNPAIKHSDPLLWVAALDLLPRHLVLTSQILADELEISRKASLAALHRLARVGILTEQGTVSRKTAGQPASLFVSRDLLGLAGSSPLR